MPFQLKKYSILKRITAYEKGELFLALELSGNRMVMIRKLPLPAIDRSLYLERFQNEVNNTTNLSSKNIISIIEYGTELDNFYIVMEYIDGCDLNWLICNNAFDRPAGMMILAEALQALHFSHTRGVVHCDIKPASLLIERTGRIVLTNFGLSRSITSQNVLRHFATPLFMPPEQAYLISEQNNIRNDHLEETVLVQYKRSLTSEEIRNFSEYAPQWDIWSAGVMMYRVCSGHYPFYSENFPELLHSIVYENPPKITDIVPNIPKSIAKIIGQCLQKKPYLRPHSLDPVINILQEYFYSFGIARFKELIATYLEKNFEVLPFSIEPPISTDKFSSISSQPKTEQLVPLREQYEQLNKHEHLKQEDNSTLNKSIGFPVPVFVSLQNSELSKNFCEWEFIEYKTLKYEPSETDVITENEGVLSILFRKCHYLFTIINQGIINGIKSLSH